MYSVVKEPELRRIPHLVAHPVAHHTNVPHAAPVFTTQIHRDSHDGECSTEIAIGG